MKVLIATTYIYKKEWPEFTRNRTGFGIMVNDIYESVSEEADTYLFSQVITEGHGNVLRHTWRDVFQSASLRDWCKGVQYFFRYPQSIKGRIKYFYYALNAGAFRKTIRRMKPDVVHIHGVGIQLKPFIDVCEQEQVPYLVTLHGLIGLDDTVYAAPWDKKLERDFLLEADQKDIPVTVISTGMKHRIEKNYLHHEAKNISVICNGTKIPYHRNLIGRDKLDLRKEFGLTDEKIIVAVGSICERKNQIQIVRALATGIVTDPCHVFLCGADAANGEIQRAIDENGLNDRIHLLGFLPREIIEQILDQADLNVAASKDEGLGLSIIEAYRHGVPTVTFADLDVISSLYDEKAMIRVDRKSDLDLARGIEEGLRRKWDKACIQELVKNISLEELAEGYRIEYGQALTHGEYPSIAKTCDFLSIQKELGFTVLSYIGNITENKNQIELVQAMAEIQSEKIVLALVGREVDNGQVKSFVLQHGLEDRVLLAGFCSEMDSIWAGINLNVLLSKNDGFGLSIIEGLMRGVPSMIYDDLDAVQDVQGEGVILLRRGTDQLSEALQNYSDDGNGKQLICRSDRYSIKQMRDKYLNVYLKTMERKVCRDR